VNGGVAVAVLAVSLLIFRAKLIPRNSLKLTPAIKPRLRAMALPFSNKAITGLFMIPLVVGSICFANLVSTLATFPINPFLVTAYFALVSLSFIAMARIMRRLSLGRKDLV
jgi:hypothetical protein